MVNEAIVEEIVATYELSPHMHEKLARIAGRRLNERGITNFDDVYRHISNLVDSFQDPFVKPPSIDLDERINRGSDLALHEVIGDNDPNLTNLFQEPEQTNEALELVGNLRPYLNPDDYAILTQLLGGSADFEFALENIAKIAPDVIKRMEALKEKFIFKGKFKVPRRKIVQVKFDPVNVKFKQRRYNGKSLNPLELFQANKETYSGMSRTDLFNFDPGLYHSLNRRGLLELAIPKTNIREYGGDPLAYFLGNKKRYEKLSRNGLKKADPGLYYSLLRHGQLDKTIPKRGNRPAPLPDKKIEAIEQTYLDAGGNITLTQVARQVGCARSTVTSHLEKAGLYNKPVDKAA